MEARVEAGEVVRVKPQTARIHTDTAGPVRFGFANLMKTCRFDLYIFLRKNCTKYI
jgi:hypothetical protein